MGCSAELIGLDHSGAPLKPNKAVYSGEKLNNTRGHHVCEGGGVRGVRLLLTLSFLSQHDALTGRKCSRRVRKRGKKKQVSSASGSKEFQKKLKEQEGQICSYIILNLNLSTVLTSTKCTAVLHISQKLKIFLKVACSLLNIVELV